MTKFEVGDYIEVLKNGEWVQGEVEAVTDAGVKCYLRSGDTVTVWPEDAKSARQYVNAYAVDRAYGGAEEGGWWFDTGVPLASIPVRNDAQAKAARAQLLAEFGPEYENNRTRYSVIGEENLEVYTEHHPARPFPAERPHYE